MPVCAALLFFYYFNFLSENALKRRNKKNNKIIESSFSYAHIEWKGDEDEKTCCLDSEP